MFVQPVHVKFSALTRTTRNNGPSFVVDIEHQFGGFLEAVTKEFLKYECHIRHQVDRVVPYDHNPRTIRLCFVLLINFLHLARLRTGEGEFIHIYSVAYEIDNFIVRLARADQRSTRSSIAFVQSRVEPFTKVGSRRLHRTDKAKNHRIVVDHDCANNGFGSRRVAGVVTNCNHVVGWFIGRGRCECNQYVYRS